MRVIGGSARGVRLESPASDRVRPTLDRVREALFNILGPAIQDAAFLDLFAGSGAMGIEALSRGAARAVFVDAEHAHLDLIRRNLGKAKLAERGQTVRASVPEGLTAVKGPFDYIYADPPRKFNDFNPLAEAIRSLNLLATSGQIIFETASDREFDASLAGFEQTDTRVYGRTRLTIFT